MAVVSAAARGDFSSGKNHQDLKTPSPQGEIAGPGSGAEAKMAELQVDETKFVEGSRDYSAPRAAPYSSQGVIEEVVVRAPYISNARIQVPPAYITPTLTAEEFIARKYRAINRQQAVIFSGLITAAYPVSSAVTLGFYGVTSEVTNQPITAEGALLSLGASRFVGPVAGYLGASSGHWVGRAAWTFNGEMLSTGATYAAQ